MSIAVLGHGGMNVKSCCLEIQRSILRLTNMESIPLVCGGNRDLAVAVTAKGGPAKLLSASTSSRLGCDK